MSNEIQTLTDRLKPNLRLVGEAVFNRNRMRNGITDEVKSLTSFMKFYKLRNIREFKTWLFYDKDKIEQNTFNDISKKYAIVEPVLDRVDELDNYVQGLLKIMKPDRDRFIYLLESQGLTKTSEIEIVKSGKTGKFLRLVGSK